METKYKIGIISLVWMTLLFLIVQAKVSQMVLSMLFGVLVLNFFEDLVGRQFTSSKVQKIIGFVLSFSFISVVVYFLYISFNFMIDDFNAMIKESQPLIIAELNQLGFEKNIQSIQEIYIIIGDFVKTNIGIITTSAGLLLKTIIGLLLGLIVHFSVFTEDKENTSWAWIMNKLNSQFTVIYSSFKDIMSIQALIAVMNTVIISFVAFGLTYMIFGQVLPYWYVIVPLTFILSFIPVVGNIMINILLILSTVQLSPYYVLLSIGLFLVIHKLELLVIGNKMKDKMNLPVIVILVSMILGEMLFHSMSGMILGMLMIVSISNLLKQIPDQPLTLEK